MTHCPAPWRMKDVGFQGDPTTTIDPRVSEPAVTNITDVVIFKGFM